MSGIPRASTATVAGIAALGGPQTHLREFERVLERRRELICARLDEPPHVFPRIVADHGDDREFAMRLLNEARVTVTPGSAFGSAGAHHVRMAFCVDDDVMNLAFDRLGEPFGK